MGFDKIVDQTYVLSNSSFVIEKMLAITFTNSYSRIKFLNSDKFGDLGSRLALKRAIDNFRNQ